jgi:hypothetical protein
VNGRTWLGLEVNAWSSLLFIAAGGLLLVSAPAHWAAKSMSLIVGLALGAASVIALYDKQDVFGVFAANGLTKLVWGAAGALLIVLSLVPRVRRREAPQPAAESAAPRLAPSNANESPNAKPERSGTPGCENRDLMRRTTSARTGTPEQETR